MEKVYQKNKITNCCQIIDFRDNHLWRSMMMAENVPNNSKHFNKRSKSQLTLLKFKQNTHSIQSENGIRNLILEACSIYYSNCRKKRRRAALKKKHGVHESVNDLNMCITYIYMCVCVWVHCLAYISCDCVMINSTVCTNCNTAFSWLFFFLFDEYVIFFLLWYV